MIIFLVFLLSFFALRGQSAIIEVPNDEPNITVALGMSTPNDTVWVHPGTYEARLIFPPYDIVLISDYFMTADTAALASTVIDASVFANSDTASVLTFMSGNSRATIVGGFTLTGGHGFLAPAGRWGGCIYLIGSSPTIRSCKITGNRAEGAFVLYSDQGSPAISHCEIYENCGWNQTITLLDNQFNEEPTLFEWNDVHHNFACDSPFGPYVVDNFVGTDFGHTVIRFNHFHDYEGSDLVGAHYYSSYGEVYGNVFERISSPDRAVVVCNTDFANPIRDNVFRDCSLGEGNCISLLHDGNPTNPFRSMVERNWFENIIGTFGPSCLYMQHPNAEVRENVFLQCTSSVGPVQFSQQPPQGCDVVLEGNHFFFNQATAGNSVGSAFTTTGDGPPCSFVNNWFEGNSGNAVHFNLNSYPDADMPNNYWGDPSGPYQPIENPGGVGDTVPANVHVTPWLTAPPEMSGAFEKRLTILPDEWSLENPYPNPFNSTTRFILRARKPQPFSVEVYNTLGQKVSRIWQGVVPQDVPVEINWDGRNSLGTSATSGVYYVVAVPRAGGSPSAKTVKVVLLR